MGRRQKKGKRSSSQKGLKSIRPNAAGIDIGSKEHYVAVSPDKSEEPVRCFGCYTPDLHEMAKWLISCGVETVAMESTGVYWIPVFQVLESYGLDLHLVNARHVKSVPGRKSDVQDCQWLQELHTFGLLSGSFQPPPEVSVLRGYWRHRAGLVEVCAQQIHLMQKALTLMNLHLHKAISDITGVTGLKIIRAIVSGERDPEQLAQNRHGNMKSSQGTIAASLTGDYRDEHIFALTQYLQAYDFYQDQIKECDQRIEAYIRELASKADPVELKEKPKKKNKTSRRKNEPHFDMRWHLFRLTGVDLTQIDGIDSLTAFKIVSEIGFDMSAFPSEKHFSSWLGLCPNNKKTGGRVYRSRTKKVTNRVAQALRVAAHSLHGSKTALGAYYRRMRYRLGAPKAITATAHKLAILVYRTMTHGQEYVDKGQEAYEKAYQNRVLANLEERAKTLGFQLVKTQTGEVVS